jgi:filamentous hemagglutinin family protein
LFGCTALIPLALPAHAAPSNGHVSSGQATISGGGRSVTVTQTSQRSVIDWKSFSIGSGQTARFNLPSSTAAVLNRVTGDQLSSLLGNLYSNGQVYLLNPNGVLVGKNGVVDTKGFIASTLDVSNKAFMAGGAQSFEGSSTAGITILGSVKADGGDVLLVAAQIDNKGSIVAPGGKAILAAGSEVLYVPGEDANIVIAAQAPSNGAAINNEGLIKAASAQLSAAGSAYALAVNNGGEITATGIRSVGGHVVLDGGGGDVTDSGTVTASAGTVAIDGGRVALTGKAVVYVSGAHGGAVSIDATKAAVVTKHAVIAANATGKGDGGTISIKAATATDFSGTASVAAKNGAGGRAEISGGSLSFAGKVDRSAGSGRAGTLLFDPANIRIVSGNAAAPAAVSGGLWAFASDPSGTQTISVGAVETLLAGGNLELQASNALTVTAPSGSGGFQTITSTSAQSLTLTAPTIAVNGSISLPNGTLAFQWTDAEANSFGTAANTITSNAAAVISAKTVKVDGDYADVMLNGAVTTASLVFTEPDFATDITIKNAANAIQALSLDPGGSNRAGVFDVETTSALTVSGALTDTLGVPTLVSGGDLTLRSGFQLNGQAEIVLASTGGVLDNLAGSGAVTAANGRIVIYSATNGVGASGTTFNDGGIGISATTFQSFGGVHYPSDPDTANTVAEYFGTLSTLPTMTITANSFTRTYGQADPTFTARYSGGAVGNLTVDPSFRIVQGSDIDAGIYTIEPYGAASSNHLIRYADGTLTVNPAVLTITADSYSMTYGGTVPAFGYAVSGLVNGDTASVLSSASISVLGGITANPAASVYSLSPSASVADPPGGTEANYTVVTRNGTLTVNPAPLTVTATAYSDIYGSAIGTPQLTFSGFVNGADAANVPSQFVPVVSAVAGSSVGAYAITLQNGNPNSNYAVTYVGANLTITPAPLTITPNLSKIYGASLPGSLPVADYSGFVNGDTAASLTTQPTLMTAGVNVGSYAITASGAADPNYTISYMPGTVQITPAPLTITTNNATRVYGAANPGFSATFTGLVNGDTPLQATSDLRLTTAATATSDVGEYAIVASGASATNYTITYQSTGVLSVTPAPLTIKATGTSIYGQSPATTALVTYSATGLLNGDTLADFTAQPGFSTSATSASNVGKYVLDASGAADPNYTISYASGILTVAAAQLTLTPIATTLTQGSAIPAIGIDETGLVNGDTLNDVFGTPPTVITTATTSSPAGAYPETISAKTIVDANYTVTLKTATLTIQVVNSQTLTDPGSTNINVNSTPTTSITSPTVTLSTEIVNPPPPPPPPPPVFHVSAQEGAILQYGQTLGAFGPEAGNIVNAFLAALTDTNPPTTVTQVVNALADSSTSAAMIGLLLPFAYTDLENILNTPRSSWTSAQAEFVSYMQSYIQAQRQAAALQAEVDYENWAVKTSEQIQTQIDNTPGVASVYAAAIQSGNPPVPPPDFLNEVQSGITMSAQQAVTFAGATGQLAALSDAMTGTSGVAASTEIAGVGFQIGGSGSTGLDVASALNKLSPAIGKAILPYSAKTASDLASGAKISKGTASLAQDAEEAAKVVDTVGGVVGAAGAVLEVVASAVQIGIGADLYAQQSSYNAAFQQAVNAANQPVTIADLKAMVSTTGGQQQMSNFLQAALVTGQPDPFSNPLTTAQQSISLSTAMSLIGNI